MSTVSSELKLEGLDYRVVGVLGNGAGSTILRIVDKDLGRDFALKVVKRQDQEDEIYIAQALHEFEIAQKLEHRTILKIFDSRIKRSWFKISGVELLMEFVEGRSLDALPKPELGQIVLIFSEIASGLRLMHRRGVFHGDLKPSNIMLSTEGGVKILDFGTAWIKGQPKNRVQGTPQYMAPEQAAEKIVDEKTDLYNFGATLYRILTGEYANFGGLIPTNTNGVGRGISKLKTPIEFDRSIPGTLNEMVMACLAPNPDQRPAGIFEVKHQILAVVKYLGLAKTPIQGCEPPEG